MKALRRFAIGAFWLVAVASIAILSVDRPTSIPSLVMREPQSTLSAFEKIVETPSFRIAITHRNGRLNLRIVAKDSPERVIWETPTDSGFATLMISRLRYDDRHQSYAVEFSRGRECKKQELGEISGERGKWIVTGRFSDLGCGFPFTMTLSEPKPHDLEIGVGIKHDFDDQPSGIDRDLVDLTKKLLPKWPVVMLHAKAKSNEAIFGGGAQMTYFELKGRYVPLIVREQGIGRGLGHPLLRGLALLAPGATGDATSTNAPSPVFITSENRAVVLDNYEPAAFDFRRPGRATLLVRSDAVRVHVLPRSSFPEALTAMTEYTGRMKPLPDWFNQGATLGIQGGPKRVLRALDHAKAHGVPVASVWLQDWVGRRQIDAGGLPVGSFLWWIWESDEKLYPDWKGFVASLARKKIRTLAYMNPYLVDASEKSGAQHNLFADAERTGYLVRDVSSGRAWIGNVIMFPAALVDLSNPRAFAWMKSIVKERLIDAGVSGMMADFGEALPYDAQLSEGRATSFHNRFPERWARVAMEASEDAKLGGDFVSFSRSGYLRGPASTRLFWLGDQLTTWDANDGLKSSLIGLLSGGLSGLTLNHSDIGGYTAVAINGTGIRRTKELFMRWTEVNAFTTAFRTHEGSRPELHHQFDSDDETLEHFGRFARIYTALAPYRKTLMTEASEKGWPLVRPMAFYHATDPRIRDVVTQFYLGADVIVAPVLDSRASKVRVWLPDGEWVQLWAAKGALMKEAGWLTIEAPIGKPCVFYRSGSVFARTFAPKVEAL